MRALWGLVVGAWLGACSSQALSEQPSVQAAPVTGQALEVERSMSEVEKNLEFYEGRLLASRYAPVRVEGEATGGPEGALGGRLYAYEPRQVELLLWVFEDQAAARAAIRSAEVVAWLEGGEGDFGVSGPALLLVRTSGAQGANTLVLDTLLGDFSGDE